ncbi:hypothetical protein [Flavobacterium sp. FPG59]|uniref:hypothetical protein n=1 Tax=Flavobacterium sp. FPG59 TaxID=1929267 RepID=UPI000A38DB98|nr:hypothetical protein [Flavobacterium sp. FPG59]OUD35016.1 hypothetical protein FPG59_11740 [Flavobacterium sp. FPG59]
MRFLSTNNFEATPEVEITQIQTKELLKTEAGVNNTIDLQNLSITIYFIKKISILEAKTHLIIILKKISIFNLSRLRKS